MMALEVLCLVYTVLWISVQTEDAVKHVLVLCGCRLCGVSIIYTFPLIANEVDL